MRNSQGSYRIGHVIREMLLILCFSGCLSTTSTFEFMIDQRACSKMTSLPQLLCDLYAMNDVIFVCSHWSIVNSDIEEVDKQPEKHSIS